MCKKLSIVAATLFVLGCAPIAETTDWDAADDDAVGYDEFIGGFRQAGVYDLWDADQNASLSENEWQAGIGDRFGRYDVDRWGMYTDWDTDRSGALSDGEFASGVFDSYDLDGDAVLVGDEARAFEDDAWM